MANGFILGKRAVLLGFLISERSCPQESVILDDIMTPKEEAINLLFQCDMIGKLATALHQTTTELIGTRESRPSITVVALLVRNILELRVWTEFCTKSAENAKNFQVDAIRDFDDIVKRILSVDLSAHPEASGLFKQFADGKAELEQVLEMGELDRPYQDVRKAAKEIGMLPVFNLGFKILSKFAHPTAMVIAMGKLPDERYTSMIDTFIKAGGQFAKEALLIGKSFNENVRETISKGLEGTV